MLLASARRWVQVWKYKQTLGACMRVEDSRRICDHGGEQMLVCLASSTLERVLLAGMFSVMPVRELRLFEFLSLNWVMFAITIMCMEIIYSGPLTILLLNHWHTVGAYWSSNYSCILSSNPFSPVLANQLSLLTLCVLLPWNQHPMGILDVFILLSAQAFSWLSCEFLPPLPNLLTFPSDSVSKPVYISFHVVTCISEYAYLAPRGYL